MTNADKQEPVACPECGHLAGEESDLLTIAYMSGAYDERKARENGLRPTSDLAERIEGLVAAAERVLAWAGPLAGDNYEEAAAVEEEDSVALLKAAITALKESQP